MDKFTGQTLFGVPVVMTDEIRSEPVELMGNFQDLMKVRAPSTWGEVQQIVTQMAEAGTLEIWFPRTESLPATEEK